jgi:hypothetical protein
VVCQFEFAAPDSPQQNGKVEIQFATLYDRVRAILNEAQFIWPLGNAMWVYSSLQATKLGNLSVRPDAPLSPYECFMGKHQHGLSTDTHLEEWQWSNLLLKYKQSWITKVSSYLLGTLRGP